MSQPFDPYELVDSFLEQDFSIENLNQMLQTEDLTAKQQNAFNGQSTINIPGLNASTDHSSNEDYRQYLGVRLNLDTFVRQLESDKQNKQGRFKCKVNRVSSSSILMIDVPRKNPGKRWKIRYDWDNELRMVQRKVSKNVLIPGVQQIKYNQFQQSDRNMVSNAVKHRIANFKSLQSQNIPIAVYNNQMPLKNIDQFKNLQKGLYSEPHVQQNQSPLSLREFVNDENTPTSKNYRSVPVSTNKIKNQLIQTLTCNNNMGNFLNDFYHTQKSQNLTLQQNRDAPLSELIKNTDDFFDSLLN